MDERRVDLVRVPREEQVFDREDVFGRDASSVFPTEFKKQQQEDLEAMKEAIGAKKFISETELLELKSGGAQDALDTGPIKPLAEILKERKEAKDAEFQQQWKLMKQGKNRPLDEEDVEFLDSTIKADIERMKQQREEEQRELERFRKELEAAREAPAGEPGEAEPLKAAAPTVRKPTVAQALNMKKPVVKPIIRAVVKAKPKEAASAEPDAKRPRADEPAAAGKPQDSKGGEDKAGGSDGEDGGEALVSLLGDYNSDNDDL